MGQIHVRFSRWVARPKGFAYSVLGGNCPTSALHRCPPAEAAHPSVGRLYKVNTPYKSLLRSVGPSARPACGHPERSRFIAVPESAPCTSRLFLRWSVHFARFLARGSFRARKEGKCTSKSPPAARFGVHFRHILAGRRALRLIPCTKSRRCKDSGEVHAIVQESRGSARLPDRRPPSPHEATLSAPATTAPSRRRLHTRAPWTSRRTASYSPPIAAFVCAVGAGKQREDGRMRAGRAARRKARAWDEIFKCGNVSSNWNHNLAVG